MGLEENLALGRKAADFARHIVKFGTTHLGFDALPEERQRELEDMRDIMRELTDYDEEDPFSLIEVNGEISRFQNEVDRINTFEFGNCHEMACIGLDYVLKESKQRAELCILEVRPDLTSDVMDEEEAEQLSDHAFLLIGSEAVGDEIYEPEKWGKDAVICDPWSGDVFPAHEYKTQLRRYDEKINRVGKYEEQPPFYDTRYLRAHKGDESHLHGVVKVYQVKIERYARFVNQLLASCERALDDPALSQDPVLQAHLGTLYELVQSIESDMKGVEKYLTEAPNRSTNDIARELSSNLRRHYREFCKGREGLLEIEEKNKVFKGKFKAVVASSKKETESIDEKLPPHFNR